MREVFQQELREVQERLVEIAELVAVSIDKATRAFNESNVGLAEEVIADDDLIDQRTLALDELATESPSSRRARPMPLRPRAHLVVAETGRRNPRADGAARARIGIARQTDTKRACARRNNDCARRGSSSLERLSATACSDAAAIPSNRPRLEIVVRFLQQPMNLRGGVSGPL